MVSNFLQKTSIGPNGWMVWSISGRIDMLTADAVYNTGEEIVLSNPKTVLDMSEMDYISSAGLRALLRLNKLAKKEGRTFSLACPSGIVKSVLEDSGMDALFAVWASLEEVK